MRNHTLRGQAAVEKGQTSTGRRLARDVCTRCTECKPHGPCLLPTYNAPNTHRLKEKLPPGARHARHAESTALPAGPYVASAPLPPPHCVAQPAPPQPARQRLQRAALVAPVVLVVVLPAQGVQGAVVLDVQEAAL
jgi:hypothetical protein